MKITANFGIFSREQIRGFPQGGGAKHTARTTFLNPLRSLSLLTWRVKRKRVYEDNGGVKSIHFFRMCMFSVKVPLSDRPLVPPSYKHFQIERRFIFLLYKIMLLSFPVAFCFRILPFTVQGHCSPLGFTILTLRYIIHMVDKSEVQFITITRV